MSEQQNDREQGKPQPSAEVAWRRSRIEAGNLLPPPGPSTRFALDAIRHLHALQGIVGWFQEHGPEENPLDEVHLDNVIEALTPLKSLLMTMLCDVLNATEDFPHDRLQAVAAELDAEAKATEARRAAESAPAR